MSAESAALTAVDGGLASYPLVERIHLNQRGLQYVIHSNGLQLVGERIRSNQTVPQHVSYCADSLTTQSRDALTTQKARRAAVVRWQSG